MWYYEPEWMIVWVTIAYTIVSTLTLIAIGVQVWLSKDTARRQLRAYLAVEIDNGSYQDRDKGIKFAGFPRLKNTGQTPAHDVALKNNCGILPMPLPSDYVLPSFGGTDAGAVLGVGAIARMDVVLDNFCDDREVASIMDGSSGRAFYCWGLITYKDAFGGKQSTTFCQRMLFIPNPSEPGKFTVDGQYTPGRNHAT